MLKNTRQGASTFQFIYLPSLPESGADSGFWKGWGGVVFRLIKKGVSQCSIIMLREKVHPGGFVTIIHDLI